MKKIALWLSVLGTLTAQAEILTSGGFGTKGTTGESIPLSSSVSDAAAIYHAMKIKPVMGRKGLKLEDGTSFECEEPRSNNFSGMSASCVFIFRETARS